MARREKKPVWLNLEYLSAEDWVADFHLRPSPHPRHALDKTFFFPGLGPGTGGVLKERFLDTERETFDRDTWWHARVGIAPPPSGTTVISMFAYENPAIDTLLEQWRDSATPIALLVPEGRISGAPLPAFSACRTFSGGEGDKRIALGLRAGFRRTTAFRRPALGRRPEFRARRGFVRAGAMGAKTICLAHLPARRRRPPAQTRRRARHYANGLPDGARAALERFWHAWNGAGTPGLGRFLAKSRAAGTARCRLGGGTGERWRSGWKSGGIRENSVKISGYPTACSSERHQFRTNSEEFGRFPQWPIVD
jgi:hypothetical protein